MSKPDRDPIGRAHLRDPADTTHRIHRYPAPPELASHVRRFWIPVWSVPEGHEAPQRVLQYPVVLVVVTAAYARCYGPARGLSTTILTGEGWGVGAMLRPSAGAPLLGADVADWTDRFEDLEETLGRRGRALAGTIRSAMSSDPNDPASHRYSMDAFAPLFDAASVDAEGALADRIVEYVESRPDVTRVSQVIEEFGISERALQRLCGRRIGMPPKWLIQRRRLHDGVHRLRSGGTGTVADIAADLGYTDQAQFTRHFRAVTGMPPAEFAAWQHGMHRR
ncbi:helix-turn-helix domain-containing protein [Tsukamurella sp. 8F]|uniref:AraC family transcriptional regulator n=1 Tax=unclassified Tsukamurella TaxID=2633480 RepID=UPI0023B9B5E4|nr:MULTISPECIES: helix-turn-helix domain-containing protein [unclassified Tsukamurella]MDF0529084.1 helix-turn-helix domain-containing protein [Tsukamurella sp. 8J]MDF0587458.1 helix-turn-helix domain-containing protein [Tsukamurella sp. 8F]